MPSFSYLIDINLFKTTVLTICNLRSRESRLKSLSEANLLGVDSYYTARDTREARENRNPSRNNQGRIQLILLIRMLVYKY